MGFKTTEIKKAYHRDYYQRLKRGEVLARGTRPVKDILGKKFNCLLAIRFSHRQGFLQRPYWEFQCDCGNHKVLAAAEVITGKTKSCGCLPRGRRGPRIGEGMAAFNSLYLAYKTSCAKSRGLEFSLSIDEFSVLTKGKCKYCGVDPIQVWTGTAKKSSPYLYNGIDRVDNTRGYTKENCTPCCKVCNIAKHAMSLEEFMSWIRRLTEFQHRESDAIASEEINPCSI